MTQVMIKRVLFFGGFEMSYASITMTEVEIDTFLSEKRHAVLATNRIDGPPQVSPVWYLYREGKIFAGISPCSAKGRNIKRDPRVSLCVDGCYPDARYVVCHGRAELLDQPSAWRDGIERAISLRYHETEEEADRSLSENGDPDQVLLVITPEKIVGQDYN
jgi:PPOX class probable F420-dependent enzyme